MTTITTDQSGVTFESPDETLTIAAGVTIFDGVGIGAFSNETDDTLANHGTIISKVNAVEFNMGGGFSKVINGLNGTVVGDNGLLFANSSDTTTTLTNSGSIRGAENLGVGFYAETDNVAVTNSGYIFGHIAGLYLASNFNGGVVHNSGIIGGDNFGVEINTATGLVTTVVNNAGARIAGPVAGIEVLLGSLKLTNHGTIAGDVDAGADPGGDVIVNNGRITGDVSFSGSYNGADGTSGAIHGGKLADRIVGGDAGDRIDGGGGDDKLTGNGGADHFYFTTALNEAKNVDKITDFTPGTDTIELPDNIFKDTGTNTLAAKYFHVGAAPTDATDRIIYNPDDGHLSYDRDGTGTAHDTILFAVLSPHLNLQNTDFDILTSV